MIIGGISGGVVPPQSIKKTAAATEVAQSGPLDDVRLQAQSTTDAAARSGFESAQAATSAGLFAPGALVTVAQVGHALAEKGVEFRQLSPGFWGGQKWKPLAPDKIEKAQHKKHPIEYRVDDGKWVRVSNLQQLAQILHTGEFSGPAQASERSQGLAVSAQATAAQSALAAGGGVGASVAAGQVKWSCPFRLQSEPPRVSTADFLMGLARHMDNPVEFFSEYHQRHGSNFQVKLPTGQRLVFDHRFESVHDALKVTDHPKQPNTWHKPELQGHGLSFLMGMDNVFLASGDEWRKTHGVMRPHLSGPTVNGQSVQVGQVFERHIQRLKDGIQAAGGEAEFDFRKEMQLATLDVAMQVLFGAQLGDKELLDCQQAFQTVMKWLPIETANPTDFSLSRLPGNSGLKKAYQHLQGLADQMVARRRLDPSPAQDILGALVQAVDPDTGKPFSDERLRNEVLTLMLAGHETTATMLSWSFAELSRKPELWSQLQQEVDQKLNGKFPNADQLKELDVVDNTFNETLRLYSPAYFLVREASEDTEIGPPGATLKAEKGTQLMMSTFHMHRDSANWGEDAEEFRPERFEEADKGKMVPFGSGARVCMGQHLARLEARMLLTRFAQEFEMVGCPNAPLTVESDISVHPSDAKIRLRCRSEGPVSEGPPAAGAAGAGQCPYMAKLQA